MSFLLCLLLGLGVAWPAAGLYVKMPEAPKAFVFDSRHDGQDARISALCLAGMINQGAAEAYVLTRDHDREQLDMSRKPYEVAPHVAGPDSGLRTLFQKYQGRVQKAFLYDTTRNWTFYLAMMAASQQNGIPVSQTVLDSLRKQFAWNGAVEDFRSRWPNRIAAYDWAVANLMPGCTRKSVFVIKYDRGIPLFDYASAAKGFVFWLDFDNAEETAMIERILQAGKYPVGASLMGYANVEDHANKVANKFGIGYVASDYYANGSFWSSFPNKTYWQDRNTGVAPEKGKVYVSLLWSDGDNIQFDQNGIYALWKDPARGTVPVGTPLNPGLQELNPPLLDYFYANRKPMDELISGPCGFQFIYTVFFNASMYAPWLELNRKWLADAGFHAGSLWWTTYPTPAYDDYFRTCGLDGFYHNYNNPGFKPIFQNGVGMFKEYITECRTTDCVYRDLAAVASNPAAPEFRAQKVITPNFQPNGYGKLKAVVDSLNRNFPGKYVFLLPTAFIATARTAFNIPSSVAGGAIEGGDRSGFSRWHPGLSHALPQPYFSIPDGLRDAKGREWPGPGLLPEPAESKAP